MTNPCWSTSVNTLVLSSGNANVEVSDGDSVTITFTRPTNGVEVSTGIPLVCGSTSYAVFADTNEGAPSHPSAITIKERASSPGTYEFTFDSSVSLDFIAHETSKNHVRQIRAMLDSYPNVKSYKQVTIQVNRINCDCSYTKWTLPAHVASNAPVAASTVLNLPTPSVDESNN